MLVVPGQIAEINHTEFAQGDYGAHRLRVLPSEKGVFRFIFGLEFRTEWIGSSRARQWFVDQFSRRRDDLDVDALNWEL